MWWRQIGPKQERLSRERLDRWRERLGRALPEPVLERALVVLVYVEIARFAIELLHEVAALVVWGATLPLAVVRAAWSAAAWLAP